MAAAEQQPPAVDGGKALSALLGGIAQAAYYVKADITEELLRGQLYPEAAPEEFRALRAKMGGLLQVAAGGRGREGERSSVWASLTPACGVEQPEGRAEVLCIVNMEKTPYLISTFADLVGM